MKAPARASSFQPLSAFIVALLLAAALPCSAATGWRLVWSDEFDQPDGSLPSSAKWVHDLGGHGWGNNELQTYTSRTNNARIENGQLVIEARKENFTGSDGIARGYTSARLKTKGKAAWTYGRIEARLKIPRGQGIWPAFWMLGANIDTAGWPGCGEIDIMENIGSVTNRVHGTIHGPGYSGGNGIGGSITLPGGVAYADDFHVFVVEWETNRMRWFMDGQQYFTATPASLPGGSSWVFTQPQFVLLNLAVGGNWPGNPNASTVFPQRLTVDYVRVYAASNAPSPECGANVLPNPGFEIGGLSSWTTYGSGGNTLLGSSSELPVHGGSSVFKVFGQFTGSENYSGIFRDIPAAPGTNFTAQGWALTPEGDNLVGANTAWIEVSFRNPAANILGIYRSSVLQSNSPTGVWHLLTVTNQLDPGTFAVIGDTNLLVAPAGTTFARYQVVFRQPANAAGAALFDDLVLWSGEAESPIKTSATRSGNFLNLAFLSFLGWEYEVRYKHSLIEHQWQVLTNLTGNGSTRTVTDSLSASQRFYQVVRLCN